MKVIKEGRDITIKIDQGEAQQIVDGLNDLPLITDEYSVYVRSGVELRLELIALVGTEAEKRKACEELEQLTPLTQQDMERLYPKAVADEAAYEQGVTRPQ